MASLSCSLDSRPGAAGRLVLNELDRLAAERAEFAFETTLSGLGYVKQISEWKRNGYSVEIAYLRIVSTWLALSRVAVRVRQGDHDVPAADVVRRFQRGWTNFLSVYKPLADEWTVYENSNFA